MIHKSIKWTLSNSQDSLILLNPKRTPGQHHHCRQKLLQELSQQRPPLFQTTKYSTWWWLMTKIIWWRNQQTRTSHRSMKTVMTVQETEGHFLGIKCHHFWHYTHHLSPRLPLFLLYWMRKNLIFEGLLDLVAAVLSTMMMMMTTSTDVPFEWERMTLFLLPCLEEGFPLLHRLPQTGSWRRPETFWGDRGNRLLQIYCRLRLPLSLTRFIHRGSISLLQTDLLKRRRILDQHLTTFKATTIGGKKKASTFLTTGTEIQTLRMMPTWGGQLSIEIACPTSWRKVVFQWLLGRRRGLQQDRLLENGLQGWWILSTEYLTFREGGSYERLHLVLLYSCVWILLYSASCMSLLFGGGFISVLQWFLEVRRCILFGKTFIICVDLCVAHIVLTSTVYVFVCAVLFFRIMLLKGLWSSWPASPSGYSFATIHLV